MWSLGRSEKYVIAGKSNAARPTGTTSNPTEIEWQALTISLDSELAAQADVQSIAEHDEAGGDNFDIGGRDLLPFRACCDRDWLDRAGDFRMELAESRDPVLGAKRRTARH